MEGPARRMDSLNTYCCGGCIHFHRPITKNDMVSLCCDLELQFQKEGYAFEPDAIGDGFIKFANYAGDDYKCMRLHEGSSEHNWPQIPTDVMTAWIGDETIIIKQTCRKSQKSNRPLALHKHQRHHTTFLKAFNGAPAWTTQEHKRFELVFQKYGIQCTKVPRSFAAA